MAQKFSRANVCIFVLSTPIGKILGSPLEYILNLLAILLFTCSRQLQTQIGREGSQREREREREREKSMTTEYVLY